MKKLLVLVMSAMLATNMVYATESKVEVPVEETDTKEKEEKAPEKAPEEKPEEQKEDSKEEPKEEPKEVKKGSIKMKFEKAKEGLNVTVYKVANIEDGEYVLVDEYKAEKDIDLNKANDANSLLVLTQKLEKVVKDGISQKTKANGEVSFEDLEEGVYLVKTADDKEYDKVQTVLVSIPTFDEKEAEMMYDIEITAKTTPRELVDEPKPVPQTGVSRSMYVFGGIALVAIIAGVSIGLKKKK